MLPGGPSPEDNQSNAGGGHPAPSPHISPPGCGKGWGFSEGKPFD